MSGHLVSDRLRALDDPFEVSHKPLRRAFLPAQLQPRGTRVGVGADGLAAVSYTHLIVATDGAPSPSTYTHEAHAIVLRVQAPWTCLLYTSRCV